ncbi:glycosyltransferase [bacterium]|nr:glycosyltransferase [bacterium]
MKKPEKDIFVSVILPTYNEKGNVIPLIKAIHENLEGYHHEIIVADDDSPDETYEAVKSLNYDFVKPILRTKSRGFANSIRCGIEHASGNVITVMDSDFNHRPEYLPFMINNIQYYDCVTASRFLYGGAMDSRLRHYLSWIFDIFTRILTGGMITDSLYGYFAIKKEVLNNIDFDKVFWGYGDYCIRLFYYLQVKRINVLQFPAVNGKRIDGEGSSRLLNVFIQYAKEVLKLTIREKRL